ncbi:hypothetical protein QYF61_006042 [Mycteria americana]|uniref:Uncharacterized protein n=1 Tax=Mycteria americana TaxID=33587 RepID=A0AAN7P479_MYCAM|nr:hypothetical protein QYF61_006042 [Mycteria americana]
MMKTIVRQAVPLQPMEVHGGADIHLQPMRTPRWSRWMCAKEAVTLWEAHAGAGSWQDLWTHGERSPCWSRFVGRACDPVEDPCWSSLFLKDCTLWKGPMLEQFVKNCSPWEELMLEKFVEDCLLWEGSHAGAGEESEGEGTAETMCDELIATAVPRLPLPTWGEEIHWKFAFEQVTVPSTRVHTGVPACPVQQHRNSSDALAICQPRHIAIAVIKVFPGTADYLGEEIDPHLTTTSFQAKQPQFPQLLLRRFVLQSLHQLRCPSLDTLQHLNVSLVVRGPKLNTVFEMYIYSKKRLGRAVREETNPHLATASSQGVVESDKVSPQPPFLQAKQPQFPQLLLTRLLLQTLHQLRCPSLDTLQHLNVSLVVRGPKLNTGFEVRPHQCRVQGHDHFPSPAGHTISDTSQDAIGFLGHLATLLAHTQPAVDQHSQVLFRRAAFQPLFPKLVALHGVVVMQAQDPALGLVEPHTIGLGPSIQPVQVPLQSLPTLKQINTPAQLGVICKLTEGALDPLVQIIDKDIKQNWPQH